MTQVEKILVRKHRRPMHSGLAGVQSEPINLGPVSHDVNMGTEALPVVEKPTVSYSVLDQLKAASRMVLTEPGSGRLSEAKNNWTGR